VRSVMPSSAPTLVTEPNPKLPLVEADQVQLQQVLLNLIVNALEAMRETPAAERRMITLWLSTIAALGQNMPVFVNAYLIPELIVNPVPHPVSPAKGGSSDRLSSSERTHMATCAN
jgi:hypothetical protein